MAWIEQDQDLKIYLESLSKEKIIEKMSFTFDFISKSRIKYKDVFRDNLKSLIMSDDDGRTDPN